MLNAKQLEVGLDHHQHCGDRAFAEQDQPVALRRCDERIAMLLGEILTDRDQIVARIETFWDIPNIFAQRFTVPHVDRTGEDIDLTACIIHIIFADDLMARIFEQRGEGIAHHRAAAMPHVHWTCRVGRDIFHVHRLARANGGSAIGIPGGADQIDFGTPCVVRQLHVDEAGARDVDSSDLVQRGKLGRQRFGQRAWVHPRRLGEDHGGVGRQIPMA